jgi:hypothetical protein
VVRYSFIVRDLHPLSLVGLPTLPIKTIHQVEEERPIETLWDVTVAATAHARSIPNNDKRLEIERTAGALLKAA